MSGWSGVGFGPTHPGLRRPSNTPSFPPPTPMTSPGCEKQKRIRGSGASKPSALERLSPPPAAGAPHLPSQAPKDLGDVGVVPARLGDGHSQLRVAERAQGSDASTQDPDEEGQTHGARVL